MNEIILKASDLLSHRKSFIIATLIDVVGGAPQELGAKMIVESNGSIHGTIGGGKIEARVTQEALSMLEHKKIERFTIRSWNLQSDIGMTCGGKVSVSFETYGSSSWNIAVFGAGHVSQALCRTLITLDCSVTCIDPRIEWTAKLPEHPQLKILSSIDISSMPKDTFFVIMTQGHSTDLPILIEIFKHHPNAFYVGCMGSEVKAIRLRKDLQEAGITKDQSLTLHTPIGLPIGENTPQEIAISVTAQLLEERSRFTRTNDAPMIGKD